ncbi:hypothetical protein [Mycolicibacterium palauense]|uniref:hypothetical protein n=1 Tax=Mycolicibacterium palauense TaxID=2034511 RepID=UPI001FE822BF|nr:hypothetical protein [Mycolicibacterium palauense]
MARNDNPDDDIYGEPTQYANYGGSGGQAYSEVPQQPDYTEYGAGGYGYPSDYPQPGGEPPTPWYQKPAALVGLGAVGVVVVALIIYAIVSLAGGSSDTTDTTTTTPTTTEAGEAPAPVPGETQTVTETAPGSPTTSEAAPTTTTEAPTTTTTEPTTTTPSPSVSTSTVTETVTQSPTRTWPTLPTLFPRPGDGGGDSSP